MMSKTRSIPQNGPVFDGALRRPYGPIFTFFTHPYEHAFIPPRAEAGLPERVLVYLGIIFGVGRNGRVNRRYWVLRWTIAMTTLLIIGVVIFSTLWVVLYTISGGMIPRPPGGHH